MPAFELAQDPDYERLVREGSRALLRTHPWDVLVAIDKLEKVIDDPEKEYSAPALDALAHFYANRYLVADAEILDRVAAVMIKAKQAGLRSRIHAIFDSGTSEPRVPLWSPVCGFASQRYRGGFIRRAAFAAIRDEAVAFDGVNFLGVGGIAGAHYDNCRFQSGSFNHFHEDDLPRNTFESCDFSGCEITPGVPGAILTANLKQGRNFCLALMPPRLGMRIDFGEIFELR